MPKNLESSRMFLNLLYHFSTCNSKMLKNLKNRCMLVNLWYHFSTCNCKMLKNLKNSCVLTNLLYHFSTCNSRLLKILSKFCVFVNLSYHISKSCVLPVNLCGLQNALNDQIFYQSFFSDVLQSFSYICRWNPSSKNLVILVINKRLWVMKWR